MAKINYKLRIHGDNILECENALKLAVSSLRGRFLELAGGSAYSPVYKFISDGDDNFYVQLFPGYGRWNFPIEDYISSLGGQLRESPDAIITRLEIGKDKKVYENPLIALEFSGALPAGNNAWQRTGRALALAYAGIPYLYFAEIGGQELDSERKIKAARFPNPLVPFAYAVLGKNSGSVSLPIYAASPSSNKKIVEVFDDCFGTKESIEITRGILLSKKIEAHQKEAERKVLKMIDILSKQRKRDDILKPKEWEEFYKQKSGLQKAKWLIKKAMPWNKKIGIKDIPATFYELLKAIKEIGAVAVGSKEMPICIISDQERNKFSRKIKEIYGDKIEKRFIDWLSESSRPLICVWVAGFKPKGDDSRPDRGLVPLARMIFGIEDLDLLTIVYGPAKIETWGRLENDMRKLANTNGLWEAIVKLSNGILIDSSTGTKLKNYGFIVEENKNIAIKKLLPMAVDVPKFGEQDIDSVLHLLFSNKYKIYRVYESMCNPPGGDWSGINILDPLNKKEFRWTSLPRVSGSKSKRPDHLIEFCDNKKMLSIESKDTENKLERNIGPRLVEYVNLLINKSPTSVRPIGEDKWTQYKGKKIDKWFVVSGAAFRFKNVKELKDCLVKGKVNIVFGIEFVSKEKLTIVHVVADKESFWLIPIIKKLSTSLNGLLRIETH